MTDFANNESDGEQGVYSCADCGLKTNYAGLYDGFLKPDQGDGDLVCADCLAARKEDEDESDVQS